MDDVARCIHSLTSTPLIPLALRMVASALLPLTCKLHFGPNGLFCEHASHTPHLISFRLDLLMETHMDVCKPAKIGQTLKSSDSPVSQS